KTCEMWVVTGAGAISYAVVATAKAMIKKYGKKYAAAW
ncbi:uberolysin/carnocyclin family circular bacteriocin, partial [Heyndrickxia faecalis]